MYMFYCKLELIFNNQLHIFENTCVLRTKLNFYTPLPISIFMRDEIFNVNASKFYSYNNPKLFLCFSFRATKYVYTFCYFISIA